MLGVRLLALSLVTEAGAAGKRSSMDGNDFLVLLRVSRLFVGDCSGDGCSRNCSQNGTLLDDASDVRLVVKGGCWFLAFRCVGGNKEVNEVGDEEASLLGGDFAFGFRLGVVFLGRGGSVLRFRFRLALGLFF